MQWEKSAGVRFQNNLVPFTEIPAWAPTSHGLLSRIHENVHVQARAG